MIDVISRTKAPMQPDKFALACGFLLCMGAIFLLASARHSARVPNTLEELRAVEVASRYVAADPYVRRHLANAPGIVDGWTSWDVTFPPACSITGDAGTTVTIERGTFKVIRVRGQEAVCAGRGWREELKTQSEARPAA